MDEHKDEGGSVGNYAEAMEEADKEHGVPVKTETLGDKVDVPAEEPSNGDANLEQGLDSGICSSSQVASETLKNPNDGENHGGDGSSEPGVDTGVRSLEVEDGGKDNSVSTEKPQDADAGRAEETGGSVACGVVGDAAMHEVETKNGEVLHDAEGADRTVTAVGGEMIDASVKPEIESKDVVLCDDAKRANKTVSPVEVEMTDDMAKPDVESKNDEIHESTGAEKIVSSVGSEVNDEKSKQEVEVKNSDACDTGTDIQTEEPQLSAVLEETLVVNEENHAEVERDGNETQALDGEKSTGTTEIMDGEEKKVTKKTEEDDTKMDVECENTIEEGMDEKVDVLHDEKRNPRSETVDAKPPETGVALEEHTQVTKEETDVPVHGEGLGSASKVDNARDSAEDGSAAEKCPEKQVGVADEGEGKAEAMEIDSVDENLSYPQEEQVEKVDTVGGSIENAGDESTDVNTVQSQEVPIAEVDRDDSNVETKTEIEKRDAEEQRDNDATTGEFTDKIVSTDSAEPDGPTEEAVTGEVAPVDQNVLFDPTSDIAKFIDFSGVLPWSGNVQELKAETRDVSVEEGTQVTYKAEEITAVDGQKGVRPDVQVEGSVENVQESMLEESKGEDTAANIVLCDPNTVDEMEIDKKVVDSENLSVNAEGTGKNSNETDVDARPESSAVVADGSKEVSDGNLDSSFGNNKNLEPQKQEEEKVQECLDKKVEEQEGTRTEQQGDGHEAPNNQEQDTKMEEKLEDAEHLGEGNGSDSKTNELKRKADSLGEDSSQGRKTISVAKVSVTPPHLQKPSFKIGECIARAASQMAGSPSVLRGSNFSDENLSVENFLSQLHSAATEPAKGDNVSEIAAGFFLDYRNSLVSQQFTPDKVCGKRGRPSNSNTGGAEAFEFEEMSDTYWTDRVIHNGGEEQTPPTEKANYQIVPVELKPAQVQRGRRPYTKRRHTENNNSSHLASEKPAGFDENSPAELIMNFSETDTIPSEINLNKMFRHFGPIRESQTEVDRDSCRARVVFKKCADAEVAYSSAGRFSIFGSKVVNYELSYTITEPFKVQPYVVSLGEEDASLCPPSQS